MAQLPPRTSSLPQGQPPTLIARSSTPAAASVSTADQFTESSRAAAVPSSASTTQPPAPGSALLKPNSLSEAATKQAPGSHAADFTSSKATAAFVRRTLCAHSIITPGEKGRNTPRPIDELLPPLTSSNEVDLQLYAIIAVIIKEFVNSWYTKITPDQVFVGEVVRIIAHCTRALEQRLREVDLEAVLLDELPALLEAHIRAYRISRQTSREDPLAPDSRQIYHILSPHPALSPVPNEADAASVAAQKQNEEAWRQLLVHGVLAVLLPTEDLENGCLRALVSEIFCEMIIGNALSERACEGWQLWDGIRILAEQAQQARKAQGEGATSSSAALSKTAAGTRPPSGRSQGAQVQVGGGRGGGGGGAATTTAPASRRRLQRIGLVETGGGHETRRLSSAFWLTLQYVFVGCSVVRAVVVAVATWTVGGRSGGPAPAAGPKRAMVSMRVWACMAGYFQINERMPWLAGAVALGRWAAVRGPGRVGGPGGALDRFLSQTVRSTLHNPTLFPNLLRVVRAALFPHNAPAPPRPLPSSQAEIDAVRRASALALLSLIPTGLPRRILFEAANREKKSSNRKEGSSRSSSTGHGGEYGNQTEKKDREEMAMNEKEEDDYDEKDEDEAIIAEVESKWLDCFEDKYLNKHLIFGVLELLIVRLLPELAEKGVKELLEDRLGAVGA